MVFEVATQVIGATIKNTMCPKPRLSPPADQSKMEEVKAMKACGQDHTSKLDTVNNMSLLDAAQKKTEEAGAMYRRALEGKE